MRFFVFGILLLVAGCSTPDDGVPCPSSTPREMFETVVLFPVPSGVSRLEGFGNTWQGYNLYLRFEATDEVIDRILATGYKPTTWSAISQRLSLPEGHGDFTPAWSPSTISVKKCYEASASNNWTHDGTHCLLIDRSTGTVYFYGVGA